jgi:hypothetical protein
MHDDMSDQAIETDGNGKAQSGLDRAGRSGDYLSATG